MPKKIKRKYSPSSGITWKNKITRRIKRLTMKINRWERNQSDPKKEKVWPTPFAKHSTPWDTSGLKKHKAFLENLLKKGKKTKAF